MKNGKYIEKSIVEYCNELSSSKPIPGGGSVSGIVGALAASLGSMVANLTIGKKAYEDIEDEMKDLAKSANTLKKDLLDLAEEDIRAFEPLSKAYGIKAETEEEIAYKNEVMEAALLRACSVPMLILKRSARVIKLQKIAAEKGNRLALSDAGLGALLGKAAVESAILNVYINTKYMKDRETAHKLNREAETYLESSIALADEVYEMTVKQLRRIDG